MRRWPTRAMIPVTFASPSTSSRVPPSSGVKVMSPVPEADAPGRFPSPDILNERGSSTSYILTVPVYVPDTAPTPALSFTA